MRKTLAISLTIGILIVIVIGIISGIPYIRRDTVLEFQVQDSVSKRWVWDMEATMQNKVIDGFFQSDKGLKTYRFTGLQPGPAQLTIDAPHYLPVQKEIELKKRHK